jgi:DNA replication protein DnaC
MTAQPMASLLTGVVPEGFSGTPFDGEAATLAFLAEARKRDAIARFDSAVPPTMRESDWGHAGMSANRAQIERVLGHQVGAKGLLLSGRTGRGKTRSMWALMRRLAHDEARDIRYFHASDWFSQLQACLTYGRDDARGWVDAVARRPIVFVDDLGQEAIQTARSEWAMSWFMRFLDIRVSERLPLYVTTNLDAQGIAERGASSVRGDPMVRRLIEICEPIKFV